MLSPAQAGIGTRISGSCQLARRGARACARPSVTCDEAAAGGTRLLLTYDAWNRLVEVQAWTDADSDGVQDSGEQPAPVAAYRYDGLGERIVKTLADGTRLDYYYNGRWQVLEVRKDGAACEQYLWDPAYVDAPVLRWRDADASASTGLEEVVYYTADAGHNVTALVDAAGQVVERYVYTAYGTPTFLAVDWTTVLLVSAYGNHESYSGYWLDEDTGLFAVRNRYYDPDLGWITRDPAADGMNLYAYCGDMPTGMTDPTGLGYELGKAYAGGRVSADGKTFKLDEPIPDAKGVNRTEIAIVNNRLDFSPWSRGEVSIYFSGDRNVDRDAAIEAYKKIYGKPPDLEGNVFHHDPLETKIKTVNGKQLLYGRMDLVPEKLNGIGHRGSFAMAKELQLATAMEAAETRALAKEANAALLSRLKAGGTGLVLRGLAIVSWALTVRDSAEALGVGGYAYRAGGFIVVEFTDAENSVFTMDTKGAYWGFSTTYVRTFVGGAKKGQSEEVTCEEYEKCWDLVYRKYGRYIPGGMFSEPRFIPGTDRTTMPYIDLQTLRGGYLDETGPHLFPINDPRSRVGA